MLGRGSTHVNFSVRRFPSIALLHDPTGSQRTMRTRGASIPASLPLLPVVLYLEISRSTPAINVAQPSKTESPSARNAVPHRFALPELRPLPIPKEPWKEGAPSQPPTLRHRQPREFNGRKRCRRLP